jgi:N-acetylneuraminic acid mutarotase
VEYRTNYYGLAGQTQALLNYEVALYESGTPAFQFIYGSITPATIANDSQLVVGLKNTNTNFAQYGCDTTGGQSPPVTSGQILTAMLTSCGTPTPTPTTTPTPTCGPAAWQSGPPQPPARYAIQGALGTDNKLYVAGGQSGDGLTVYDQVSRYDYTTNTWSNVAPLPVPVSQAATGAANGKIYVAGGFIGGTSVTNALRIYDIATNAWTSGANMPTSPGVEAAAAAVVNGKFYVMGGDDFNNGLNTTFIYDIATNTWTTGATLPDMRTNLYGTVANGLIYVYGGVVLPAFTTTDTLLRYNPVANSWTNLGSAGTAGARGNYGGVSPLGTGQLLITDGADASGSSTTATHIFTISSGTFSAGPAMIGNRAGHAQGIGAAGGDGHCRFIGPPQANDLPCLDEPGGLWRQLDAAAPGLTMDADADFHFIFSNAECWMTYRRHRAGG